MWTLSEFYRSKEWRAFRNVVIEERTKDDGFIYDEVTGKPILRKYDIILHHVEELTEENVNDRNISLNPKNIMVVSHKTHNYIHDKLGYSTRQVFLVYGAPCSGKTTWVGDSRQDGDLVVDMDAIWRCVSGCPLYVKPNRLKSVAFRIRDDLIDMVRYRFGKWNNAYVIGGYPLQSERDRLVKDLQARPVFIEASKQECIARAEADEAKDSEAYKEYIEKWFATYRENEPEDLPPSPFE